MRFEDDPTVKKLPSERMRKQMAEKVVIQNYKLIAKAEQNNEDFLPEKLRNKGILQPPTDKVIVVLSDSKVRALDEVLSPLLDKEERT